MSEQRPGTTRPSSLFPLTRHGFLWRVSYSSRGGTVGYNKWVRAWTAWGARRLGQFGRHDGWTLTVKRVAE